MGAATKLADKKYLQDLVPLNALSEGRFAEVFKKITIEEVRKGRYLFRKGDRDNESIYLLDGKINLIDGHRKVTCEVEAGTDVSRYPIANQQPRSLTARAVTKVVIARIDSGLLDVFLTWDQSSSTEATEIRADDDEDWMTRILQSEAFIRIPPAIIQRLLIKMESFPVRAGKAIITQGDDGDYFYTIHKGQCAVTRRETPDSEVMKLAELSDGDSFGEEALVSDARRNATVTMLTDGVLMRLAKQDFTELLQKHLISNICFETASGMIDAGAVWVDVRSPGEYETGSFEDSVNIPLSDLRGELPELVFNVKYIICCDTGRRSASAAFILSHKGFDVYVLDGGINGLPADVAVTTDIVPVEATDSDQDGADIIEFGDIRDETGNPAPDTVEQAETGTATAMHASAAEQQEAVRVLQQEIAELKQCASEYRDAEHDLADRQAIIEQLETALHEAQDQMARVQQEQRAGIDELQLLREQYAGMQEEHDKRVTQLEQQLGESGDTLVQAEADATTAANEREQLQEQVAKQQHASQSALKELEQDLQASRQQLGTLQAELDTARNEAGARIDDSAAALHEQQQLVVQLRDDLDQARQQVGELEAGVASLHEEQNRAEQQVAADNAEHVAELDRMRDMQEQSRQESTELSEQASGAADRVAELEQQLADLGSSEASTREDQQSRYAELQKCLDAESALRTEAEQQLESLQQSHQDEVERLTETASELDAAHSRLQEIEKQDEILRTEKRQLEVQHQEQQEILENTSSTSQAAADALERLQGEWTQERESLNQEIQDRQKQVEALNASLEQQQELAGKEKARFEEKLQTRIEKTNAQLEQQELRYVELKETQSALAEQQQVVAAERDALQKKLDDSDNKCTAQDRELEKLNKRIAALTDTADKETQALAVQLEDEQQRYTLLEQQHSELGGTIETQQQALDRQKQENEELRQQLSGFEAQSGTLQQELKEAEERFRTNDLDNHEALNKVYEDLNRKNDNEKEMQAQIDRLRKKLEQSTNDLQAARDEERANAEHSREALQAEQRDRAEERAELAARQKQLKEQLAAIANEHQDVLSSRDGALARAKDDAREEERSRLEQELAGRDQADEQLEALQRDLDKAHAEAAMAVQQERERNVADLGLARDQKEEADNAVAQLESQLRQLTDERDAALGEQQATREQLNSLRVEVEVARGLMGAAADGELEDPVKLRADLEESRRNIEIAVRLRSEAEAQRDKTLQELEAVRQQVERGGDSPVSLDIPTLDDEPPAPGVARVDIPAPDLNSGATGEVAGQGRYGWLGKAVGLGVVGMAALIFWLLLDSGDPLHDDSTVVNEPDPETNVALPDSVTTVPAQTTQQEAATTTVPAEPLVATAINDPAGEAISRQEQSARHETPAEFPPVTAVRSFRDKLKDSSKGPSMMELPAAGFMMGSAGNSLNFDERPRHRVNVSGFSISKAEVTFAEYDRFARATGRRLPHDEGWGRGEQPVINVSWKDATAYTKWLSKQTGHSYRLPTEAEWEFAARGNSTASHWWGDNVEEFPANCFDCGSQWDGRRTAAVGSFAANGFGLHDTAGNVQEWTEDCYNSSYQGAAPDGSASQAPRCTQRVVRGGSYTSPIDSLRSAKRGQYDHDTRLDNLGFRVVRSH